MEQNVTATEAARRTGYPWTTAVVDLNTVTSVPATGALSLPVVTVTETGVF